MYQQHVLTTFSDKTTRVNCYVNLDQGCSNEHHNNALKINVMLSHKLRFWSSKFVLLLELQSQNGNSIFVSLGQTTNKCFSVNCVLSA